MSSYCTHWVYNFGGPWYCVAVAYDRLRCFECGADFGQEVRFRDHLEKAHGVVDHEALYVDRELAGVRPKCGCGCGKSLPWVGWKKGYTSRYLRGHNATVDSVYLDKERQQGFVAKRTEGLRSGRIRVWNDGLTKETDERVRACAEKISASLNAGYVSGSIVDWHITHPEKALSAASKSSATKRQRFSDGTLVIWNKGETKETHPSMAIIAQKASLVYQSIDAGNRIKQDELRKRIDACAGVFTLVSDLSVYRTRRIERLKFRCVTCGTEQSKSLAMLEETPVCFACHPKSSKGQLELYEFVRSLAPDAVLGERTLLPRHAEIDVYVPSHKLAIEYDGLWWHGSERQSDRLRSQKKMLACTQLGLRFMVVYEDEWEQRSSVVKAMLMHRLGIHQRVLDARKLGVVSVSSKQARAFFDANHLDGHTPARVTYGLAERDGNVVAMASLRRPFHRAHGNVLELARSCSVAGIHIRGWLGKLTRVLRGYAHAAGKLALVTYVDGRVGTGSGYAAAGWQLVKADTGPRFWWTDYVDRWDRFTYKADRSRGMTQQQVADEAGVIQLFGCSNSLWRFPV
jgi:hypothetical protein